MKKKIITVLVMLMSPILCLGIAYSVFNSDSTLDSGEKAIAKFIFNSEDLDQFQLSLVDLKPGDNKEYLFSVNNNSLEAVSDVSIEYQMTIKTYHFIPLIIQLYKVDGETEELIITCDETYIRDSQNELVCDTPIQEMSYSSQKVDSYKLKVQFPEEYSDAVYSDLVDYLNIEINSWQK